VRQLEAGRKPWRAFWRVSGVKVLQSRGIARPTAAEAIQAAPKLNEHGGDRKSDGQKDQGVDNTLIRGSTNATYLAARIKRDHPEIAKRVEAGKRKEASPMAGPLAC